MQRLIRTAEGELDPLPMSLDPLPMSDVRRTVVYKRKQEGDPYSIRSARRPHGGTRDLDGEFVRPKMMPRGRGELRSKSRDLEDARVQILRWDRRLQPKTADHSRGTRQTVASRSLRPALLLPSTA